VGLYLNVMRNGGWQKSHVPIPIDVWEGRAGLLLKKMGMPALYSRIPV